MAMTFAVSSLSRADPGAAGTPIYSPYLSRNRASISSVSDLDFVPTTTPPRVVVVVVTTVTVLWSAGRYVLQFLENCSTYVVNNTWNAGSPSTSPANPPSNTSRIMSPRNASQYARDLRTR